MGYVKLQVTLHKAGAPLVTLTAVRAALAISLPDGYWDADGDVEITIAEHDGDCSPAVCGLELGSDQHEPAPDDGQPTSGEPSGSGGR